MLPLALFNVLGLSIMKWLSSFTRYTIGGVLVFLMFILTNVLVPINISESRLMILLILLDAQAFLGITLASVAVINGSGSRLNTSFLSSWLRPIAGGNFGSGFNATSKVY